MECLVYIAVFAILLGSGTAAFYFCWDHSKALIYATDDIASALRAGERWRADVRAATGKISVETTATGEVVRIPEREGKLFIASSPAKLRREIPASHSSECCCRKSKLADETGCARRRDRVALGIGTGPAPQGNPFAAAVHL